MGRCGWKEAEVDRRREIEVDRSVRGGVVDCVSVCLSLIGRMYWEMEAVGGGF